MPTLLEEKKSLYPKIEPRCPSYGICGGCSLQDISYKSQIELKKSRIQTVLNRVSYNKNIPLIEMDEPWRYRNKVEFSFGSVDGELKLGYHVKGSFWKVVDIEDCFLLPEPVSAVLRSVRDLARETQLGAYHKRTRNGVFRHLIVRSSFDTGNLVVCIVTTSTDVEPIAQLAEDLRKLHPEIGTIAWGITDSVADTAIPESTEYLLGDGFFEEKIGSFRIKLHLMSFLQSSTTQAERLYEEVVNASKPCWGGIAWDLYCGVGLIGLFLSKQMRKVHSIELDPNQVNCARENALLHNISNIDFHAGLTEKVLLDRRYWFRDAKPDVIVIDPPRAGLHKQVINTLLGARPKRIIYISCNPTAMARDLEKLLAGFPKYEIVDVKAYDMFPQTNHVETLAVLER